MDITQKKRIGAFIIDALVIGLLATFGENILSLFIENISFKVLGLNFNFTFSLSILFYLLYFLFFDLVNQGVSLGKVIFKIKVVFLDHTELSRPIHLKRSLLKTFGIIILPITILLFLLNKFYTIHDHFFQTITIVKP